MADPVPAPEPVGQRSERWLRRLLIGLVVAYVGILVLAPIGALVWGAFASGPRAFLAALGRADHLAALRLTIGIGVVTVIFHTVLGTLVAWVLVRGDFWGRALVNALVDMPFAVSPVVVGYMVFLLFGRAGVLAPLVERSGIQVVFALPGLVLVTVFVTLPFMVRQLMPVLQSLSRDQEQAAATLGASPWTTFRCIVLPAIRWGMIYGVTLTFARALGEFGAVLVVGGGVRGRTETATLFIYRTLDERQYVAAYSAALLLGLLSVGLVLGTELLRERKPLRSASPDRCRAP